MSEALPAAERGVRPRAASLHAPGRGQAQPAAERAMLAQIRSRFVRRNERLLRAYDSAAVDACLAAQSVSDLLAAHEMTEETANEIVMAARAHWFDE